MPAKEWRVVPPIWNAATPVLAVMNVCSGGKTPENSIINKNVKQVDFSFLLENSLQEITIELIRKSLVMYTSVH